MRDAQVGEHFFGVPEVRDGGGEMHLAGQKDTFGRRYQISAVLLSGFRDREGIPAENVGVAKDKNPAPCMNVRRSRC